jgi:hypothetical protein
MHPTSKTLSRLEMINIASRSQSHQTLDVVFFVVDEPWRLSRQFHDPLWLASLLHCSFWWWNNGTFRHFPNSRWNHELHSFVPSHFPFENLKKINPETLSDPKESKRINRIHHEGINHLCDLNHAHDFVTGHLCSICLRILRNCRCWREPPFLSSLHWSLLFRGNILQHSTNGK